MSYRELPPTPADFEQVYGQVVLLARLPAGRVIAQHGRARVDVGSSTDFRDEAVDLFRIPLTTRHVTYVQWFDGWRMRWWDGPLPEPDAAPPALIARDGRPADVVTPEARLRAASRDLLALLEECDIDTAFNPPTVEALRREILAVATALTEG